MFILACMLCYCCISSFIITLIDPFLFLAQASTIKIFQRMALVDMQAAEPAAANLQRQNVLRYESFVESGSENSTGLPRIGTS